jgi:cell wall-associated NlpC family hydrolase
MRVSAEPIAWVVDTTGAPLWAGPGNRYAQMTTLPPGEQVTVLGVLDDWLLVQYAAEDADGWIARARLDLSPAVAGVAPVPVSDIPPLPVLTAAVNAGEASLQVGPGDRYETEATLVAGQSVELLAFHRARHDDVWLHVRAGEQVGWLPVAALTFADGTLLRVPMAATIPDPPPFAPTEQPARSPQVQPRPAAPVPRVNNQHIADYARTFIGKSYVWAAAGPDAFDCSGLVVYVYRQYGVHLPHNAAAQAHGNYGVPVAIDDLAPGDLVFFRDTYMPGISHVAIYYRDGWMVNAESPATGVRWSHIYEPYWWYRFAGARRITTEN